ncbi:aspartyl/asparaginyl beta-hydroxylase domain-containing protein [Aliikangiella maris]|uniref:Aspartyl/asparaginyl beta-hydroxylase domain-containing protein n=2 Tax=Aliikangiella maris TaxID=3162458 RepID=A0ABV3MN93_9GAMM
MNSFIKITYPTYKRIGNFLSIVELNLLVRQLEIHNHWQAHVNQQAYQGSWDVIALRAKKEFQNAHPILQCFSHESGDSKDEWTNLPIINQYPPIKGLLSRMTCPIKSVRFMRLHGYSSILPHRDPGVGLNSGEARLHIPISFPHGTQFIVAGKSVPMIPGELWYIDADREHSVVNSSAECRTHLVVDCIANDWLKNMIVS